MASKSKDCSSSYSFYCLLGVKKKSSFFYFYIFPKKKKPNYRNCNFPTEKAN